MGRKIPLSPPLRKGVLISGEDVAGVDLVFYVVEDWVVAVGDNGLAHTFEDFDIFEDTAAGEDFVGFWKSGFVYIDVGAFVLEVFHNALNGGLSEVI